MDFWTDSWNGPRRSRTVYVVADNERDAAVGLRTAETIAREMNRGIVLAVLHLVPYGTDLGPCRHDLNDIGDRFREAARSTGLPTEVRVCACRDARHLFERMLVDADADRPLQEAAGPAPELQPSAPRIVRRSDAPRRT